MLWLYPDERYKKTLWPRRVGNEERQKEGAGNGERDVKRGTTFYKTKKAVGFDNGLRHLHRRVKRSGTDIRKSACINGF